MAATNSLSHPIKWRFSFRSKSGRQIVQLIDLDPSIPFAELITAIGSSYSGSVRPWDMRMLLCDMVIHDGIISEVSYLNFSPMTFSRTVVVTYVKFCHSDLESQNMPYEIVLRSRKVEPTLTEAWKQPQNVTSTTKLLEKYRRFCADPQDAHKRGPKDHTIHVCIVGWRLSAQRLVLGFLAGVFMSIIFGGVVGFALKDLEKGLQTMQTLVGILAFVWSLLLAWSKTTSAISLH